MTAPLISVVMSVFNGAAFLAEAVESILNQSVRDFEFIIIDDGSTDASGSILESYRQSDSRVRIYTQANQGLVYSLNRGCNLAQGRYIARMDADDVALDSRLGRQMDFMETHPHVALLGGAAEFIDRRGKALRIVRPPTEDRDIRAALLDTSVFLHPTTVFRRDVFVSLGGYRPITHAEDYDLWLRFADCAQSANLKDVVLQYRLHPDQVSVRNCREQALGATAARAAAQARQAGRPDPLTSGRKITSEFMAELGVSERTRQTDLARTYLASLRCMTAIGEYSIALDAIEQLSFSGFAEADRWVVADLRLQAAQLYWHHRRLSRSMLSAGQGIIARPIVLGRPLKRLLGVRLDEFLHNPG
jgi:cellulose synthase/poly-beta-1,6-N-acetylglucosamine synthase-like glycosyltransferase